MSSNNRDANIEVLRIIIMIGIIIMHFNGYINHALEYCNFEFPKTYWCLTILNVLFYPAVDIFVIITGYFLSGSEKRFYSKPIKLLFQVVFFRVLSFFVEFLMTKSWSSRDFLISFLPLNYFVILYLVLYILSFYLDVLYNSLNVKEYCLFVFICFVIFSCLTYLIDVGDSFTPDNNLSKSLCPLGVNGSGDGYTFINFVLCYLIGGLVKKKSLSIRKEKCLILLLMLVLVQVSLLVLNKKFTVLKLHISSYNSPLVIFSAFVLFLLFKNQSSIHPKDSLIGRIVNELATAAFTVFLIHPVFLKKVIVNKLISGNPLISILKVLCMAILIYLLCYCIHKIYKLFEHLTLDKILKRFFYKEIRYRREGK